MSQSDLFQQNNFRIQYELARATGDRRFGAPCSHAHVKDGHCTKCLRKVVTRKQSA